MVIFIFNNYVSSTKYKFAWSHLQYFQGLFLLIVQCYLEDMSMSLIPRLQVQEDTDMSSLEDVSDCSSDSMEVCCEDLGKRSLNYPEFMTRILHLLCDLLLNAFDSECGHNVRLAKLDVITACAIARCNVSMLFCLCFHIQNPAIHKWAAVLRADYVVFLWYNFHDHHLNLQWLARVCSPLEQKKEDECVFFF